MADPRIGGLRVGVVGCGRMGRVHVEAIRTLGDASIDLVVCDPSLEARDWAMACRIRAFQNIEAANDAARLDAVIIAATTGTHAELVSEAFELGVAVLCEKPGGTSPPVLAELGALATRTDRPLRLAYWHRFVPALRLVRDGIASGEYGDVLALSGAQWDGSPPPQAFLAGSGGELIDMGVHEIDFARWCLRSELQARGAVWRSDPQGYNAAVGLLQSSDGTVVTVSAGRVLEGGYDGCWIELLGTKKSTFERWLWGPPGGEVNLQAVAAQDREFLLLVAGRPSDLLATAVDGAAVLDLANTLTVLATRDEWPATSGNSGPSALMHGREEPA